MNRLSKEKSPYLLQHANNPVDWFPWCEEAFNLALKEEKPVFLSIGYSTCHWCHVMERESFEDEDVASLINTVFIPIKVDREERPDIDNIYMSICQAMTGGGGWPLTVFLTPEKKPFFTGTYFPKQSIHGRIGLIDLIKNVQSAWQNKRTEIDKSADEITRYLDKSDDIEQNVILDNRILIKAYEFFEERFDKVNGGFGSHPKFPSPHNLVFLLRYYHLTGNKNALYIVEKTLSEMRKGGIYDQIGFGFHRYSTDNKWLLPHFEKMLYDQALLLNAYTELYQITKNEFYKLIAEEIVKYVSRDMTSPEGAFFSAEDADSEGVEGKYYIWKEDELKDLLTDEQFRFVEKHFNTSFAGNFRDESSHQNTGANILFLKNELTPDEEQLFAPIRKIIYEHREKRIHPFKDDKILTDWNGLMIASLSRAGRAFHNQYFISLSERCSEFILNNLLISEAKLLHRFRDGDSSLEAHVDDYSFFVSGLIELYQTTFKTDYLEHAIKLTNYAISEFWDSELGGFFFTGKDSETILARTKEYYDGAIPSGNSVFISNLLFLSRITGNIDYENKANQLLFSFSGSLDQVPYIYCSALAGYTFISSKSFEIVVVEGENDINDFISELNYHYIPNKVVIVMNDRNKDQLIKLAPYLETYTHNNHQSMIYICRNFVCELPIEISGNNYSHIFKLLE
ncbi:MAG: thioredoxin domain-containing protein [Melioribacteraceae bacterium]